MDDIDTLKNVIAQREALLTKSAQLLATLAARQRMPYLTDEDERLRLAAEKLADEILRRKA